MDMDNVIRKIALIIVRGNKLLIARKENSAFFILPGGRPEGNETDIQALAREIGEELQCTLVEDNLSYLSTFRDQAANEPGKIVEIRLYHGEIAGNLIPSCEIVETQWVDLDSINNFTLAPSIKNFILPYLIEKSYLS